MWVKRSVRQFVLDRFCQKTITVTLVDFGDVIGVDDWYWRDELVHVWFHVLDWSDEGSGSVVVRWCYDVSGG